MRVCACAGMCVFWYECVCMYGCGGHKYVGVISLFVCVCWYVSVGLCVCGYVFESCVCAVMRLCGNMCCGFICVLVCV